MDIKNMLDNNNNSTTNNSTHVSLINNDTKDKTLTQSGTEVVDSNAAKIPKKRNRMLIIEQQPYPPPNSEIIVLDEDIKEEEEETEGTQKKKKKKKIEETTSTLSLNLSNNKKIKSVTAEKNSLGKLSIAEELAVNRKKKISNVSSNSTSVQSSRGNSPAISTSNKKVISANTNNEVPKTEVAAIGIPSATETSFKKDMGPKNNEIITINNNSNTPTLNNQHSKTNVSFLISEDKDTSSLPFLQLPSQLENNAFSIPGLKTQQSSSLVQKKKPENSFDAKKSNLTRNTSKTKTKTKNENSKDKGETSKSDLNNDSNNKKSENTTIQNTKIINNISTPTTAQKALATKAASFPVNSSPLIKNIQNTPKIFSSKLSTDTGNNPKNIHKYGSTSVSATPRKQQSDMTPGNNLVTKAATTVTKKDNGEYLGTPKIIKTSSLFNSNITNQNNNAEDDVNNIGNGVIVVNIPLYTTEDNNYLDENGQVVFNFTQIINDYNKKHHPKATGNKNVNAKLAGKRNLLNVLENKNNSNKNADGEDDLGELLDDELSGGDLDDLTGDDDVDDDEDADEEVNDGYHDPGNIGNSKLSKMIMGTGGNNTPNSKKQPHPNKGKSRIGKYDIDDPFIDDSELLWEEQRAATKDGFFVFSGPLIEKGHYASFERIDGTMKRGGVRSK